MNTRPSLFNEAGRRQALKRFGYADVPPADDETGLEHEWRLLAPGIDPALAGVPLSRFEPAKRALAIDRVRQRRELDLQLFQHVGDARGIGVRVALAEKPTLSSRKPGR